MPLLTDHELSVLIMKANGYNSEQIARRTDITAPTVNTKLRRTYKKLGAHNIAQAVAFALVTGIITPNDITLPEHLTPKGGSTS